MKLNETIQWIGALLIIAGHVLNSIGPAAYPWNIVVFFFGTVAFLTWAIRVANKPQFAVNAVSIAIGLVGLYKAFG